MIRRAVVTRSIARERQRWGRTRDLPAMKRNARRKHRRAWNRWTRTGADDDREPCLRSLTSWEVW